MVDFEGKLWVQVAQRIVGERGKMNDRLKTIEIDGLERADVLPQRENGVRPPSERRAPVEVRVDADNLVPGGDHHRGHYRSDVAPAAGDEDPHCAPSIASRGQAVARLTVGHRPVRQIAHSLDTMHVALE